MRFLTRFLCLSEDQEMAPMPTNNYMMHSFKLFKIRTQFRAIASSKEWPKTKKNQQNFRPWSTYLEYFTLISLIASEFISAYNGMYSI